MGWRSSSSNERVTVDYLLERQVSLEWQEAVALVLEVAEMLERGRALPATRSVALTPAGSVEFLSGRAESGEPVGRLAEMLNALLPEERSTQLRLIVSTAGPSGASYKSVGEFSEALQYFERPGRRNLLAEVYGRALQAPLRSEGVEPKKEKGLDQAKKPSRIHRVVVPAAAVLLLGVAVVAGLAYLELQDPGSVSERAGSLEGLTSSTWDTVVGAGRQLSDSATSDLAAVFERMRGIGSEGEGDVEPSALVDAGTPPGELSSSAGATSVVPTSSPAPEVGSGRGALSAESPEVAIDTPDPSETVIEPLFPDVEFDGGDLGVLPPVTLGTGLRTVTDGDPLQGEFAVVEAIVSAAGEVEKVRLVSPPRSVHEAMLLSAIKAWRFRPATKDDHSVRYRHLIPVDLPQ